MTIEPANYSTDSRAFFVYLLTHPQMLTTLAEPINETRPADDGSEEFVDLGWWPYFKEHTNREGVEFDRSAMERIIARCNERIEDSGDYAPLVLQHTRDNDPNFHPEYAGLVGPYRLGKVGKKWAIFGRERVRKSKESDLKEHPRRSVEYWADPDNPTDGYFDPISALPAGTTPELDLGIHYEKSREGKMLIRYHKVSLCEGGPMKYEAAFPGGSNAFVPGGSDCDSDDDKSKKSRNGGDEKKLASYQSGSSEFAQMVEALGPILDARIEAAIAKLIPAPQVLQPPDDAGAVPPGGVADPAALAAGGSPSPGDADALNGGDDLGDDADDVNPDGADADADADNDSPLSKSKEPKMAADKTPAAPPADDEDDSKLTPEKKAAKYQKRHDEVSTKYSKLLVEHRTVTDERDSLKREVESSKLATRKAERYQKLAQIQQGGGGYAFNFDPSDEAEETIGFSDEQFSKHCDKIITRYQKVPTSMLPVPKAIEVGNKDHQTKAKYSKRAVDIVTAARAAGTEPPTYEAALKQAEEEATRTAAA